MRQTPGQQQKSQHLEIQQLKSQAVYGNQPLIVALEPATKHKMSTNYTCIITKRVHLQVLATNTWQW
jgi:hypothetical protein